MSEERAAPGGWPRELSLDAQAGPAPYVTRAKADALIAGALEEAGYRELPAMMAEARTAEPRRRGSALSSAAAIALLACIGVGSASAAVMWYVREQSAPGVPQPIVTQQLEARRAVAKPRRASKPVEPVVAPALPIELAPQVLESARSKLERRAPEDWLVEGNRLRGERRWAKADEAYAQALRSAPHSQTAYVARVASAAVRLEHLNDPAGALALYRAALREAPSGPLREEVLFGIADAQRALGNGTAEREALERFLREHPSSPLAAQARSRLP